MRDIQTQRGEDVSIYWHFSSSPPLSLHLRVAFAVLCESFKFNSIVRNNFHKSFCVETVANRLAAGVSAENWH